MHSSSSRALHTRILVDLRSLRASLANARNSLMHFKDDRIDRDRLEPAARRVDDLMNLFASTAADVVQGSLWVAEIQNGIDRVINPKAAEALHAARLDAAAILDAMAPELKAIRVKAT